MQILYAALIITLLNFLFPYAACNLDVEFVNPSPLRVECDHIERLPPNLHLIFASAHFPYISGGNSTLVSVRQSGITTTLLPARIWQIQVINCYTIGGLVTDRDTSRDTKGEGRTFYIFYNVHTGTISWVRLAQPTHEAHYSRSRKTLHYLRISRRKPVTSCLPLDPRQHAILEEVVEVNLKGQQLWKMNVESALCHKPLAEIKPHPERTSDVFHLNTVIYLSSSNLLLVTSQTQSTAYAIHKGTRRLIWAVGAHGTMPVYGPNGEPYCLSELHHFVPIGNDRFVTFHNNYKGNGSEVLVIYVDVESNVATVEKAISTPEGTGYREWGGAVVTGCGDFLGGGFAAPPVQILQLFNVNQLQELTPTLTCTLNSSMVYGGRLVYSDFGLRYEAGAISYHANYYETEGIPATLIVCSQKDDCQRRELLLPPFLQWARRKIAMPLPFTVKMVSSDGFRALKAFSSTAWDDRPQKAVY